MREVPDPIRRLVEQWIADGRPPQPSTEWHRDAWVADFPAHAAWLAGLPELLDRPAVRVASVGAGKNPNAAVDAYLAVMAWGYGKGVGYGRWRTGQILASRSDAADRLHAVAQALAEDGALAGYQALASFALSRLHGLGPAFGTKLLYFWQPADQRPRALILDDYVATWLNREVGGRINSVTWSLETYRAYVADMNGWAAALGIEPDDLEMCVFQSEAARRGSQWAGKEPAARPDRTPGSDGLPFGVYPHGGRELLGKPRWGDGTARRSYGVKALEWCGHRCAYCGLDMSTFEGWLQFSIDHVIPQQMKAAGYPTEWILDAINVVASCLACNGYFNRDPVLGDVPATLAAFCDLRDRVFLERRARIVERRAAEQAWFNEHIRPGRQP